ncbi:MAG TPA: isochorismatase family protein [Cyclobacteriaceae bacterium]|nr:isochorismatase family protein [Cyclobacteriaceae bacterium]
MSPPPLTRSDPKFLNIRPRYYRWHVDPGVEWLETNTGYAYLDWSIPMPQVALVLVDVWQRHYLRDTENRGEAIIQQNLIPTVAACRKYGMTVIHAPSSPVAKQHPNWVNLVKEGEQAKATDNWPPEQFRRLEGPYQAYRRPHEPREAERQNLPALTFHPDILPLPGEPVVATGEELHRYCKIHNILFLVYAGFNTNACILSRDYATLQMSNRGYQVVLLRDCTTGMESASTQATLAQTHGAILLLEMFGQYSISSDELRMGFS